MTVNNSLVLRMPMLEWWHTKPLIGGGSIALRFPYSEQMNVALRALINGPAACIERGGWDWSTRLWYVHPEVWSEARELFLKHGYTIRQMPTPVSQQEVVEGSFGAVAREAHDGTNEAWITTILNATTLDELQGHARLLAAGIRRFHKRQRDELET